MKKIMILFLVFSVMILLAGCQTIVCKEPYMRFEAGCCIDKNDNNICDEDDTGEETVQETAEEKVSLDNLKSAMNLPTKTVAIEEAKNCHEVQVPYTETVVNGSKTTCENKIASYELKEINCSSETSETLHPICGSYDYHKVAFKVKNLEKEAMEIGLEMGAWISNVKFTFTNGTIKKNLSAGDDELFEAYACKTGLRGACWAEAVSVPMTEVCQKTNLTSEVTKYRTETKCD